MDSILSYEALFFDFDGLLVNTEHLHFEAYKQMLLQNNSSFPWDYSLFASVAHKSSTGLRQLITEHAKDLLEKKAWETLYAEKTQCLQNLLKAGRLELMPAVEEMLELVKESNLTSCVVTNSTNHQVNIIKDHLPILKQIPLWVTREDYQNPKPSSDGYLKAIELLQVEGKKIGFEDSLRGIRSLQGASIDPVLICAPDHPQMEEISEEHFPKFTSFQELLSRESLLDIPRNKSF